MTEKNDSRPELVPEHDSLAMNKANAGNITKVQGNSHFYETVAAAPLNPWSKTSIQLYLILLVAALNATASGFDGSIFSSINAMPQYQTYFHHQELGSSTGIIFMIYTVGNMVGSLFTGPICDHFGRRAGMICGSVFIMVGAAVQTAARTHAYLLGGRFVLGFGVSIGTSSAPTYALELAPPQWRARVVGYYNTYQAVKILAKYHGGGDASHPMVQLELREFEASVELQKASSVWNYWALVDTRNARWRFSMMAFMSVFAQLSGNSVLTYYLPSMYKLLGIVSTERRLLLTFANSIVSCAGAVAGSATNDRIGRRTKLWVGILVLAGLFGAVTGLSSKFEGHATNASTVFSNGGVAFIFLFGCAYSFVYTPLTATYCAEVLATPNRAKGMGIHVILSNCANLYNTYVTAIALDAIDWRYYLIIVGLNVVYAVCWFVFGVETRGRTLEEMDEVFNAKWPPRAALLKATMVQHRDGQLAGLKSSSDDVE